MSKQKVTRISIAMLNHMLAYCDWAEKDGSYYGVEQHFRNRHKRIVRWLEAVLEKRITKRKP